MNIEKEILLNNWKQINGYCTLLINSWIKNEVSCMGIMNNVKYI